MTEPTLEFLGRQMQRMIDDFGHQRDSMDVLIAMVIRLEGTCGATLTEVRALQRQINRMNDRVRRLEDTETEQ